MDCGQFCLIFWLSDVLVKEDFVGLFKMWLLLIWQLMFELLYFKGVDDIFNGILVVVK